MELESIKGVGPKTLNILRRLGINNCEDLLEYYPYRYDIIKKTNVNLMDNDKVVLDGIVETNATVLYLKNRKDKMEFNLNTDNKLVHVTIFNRGFLKNKIIIGTKLTVIGKYDKKKNLLVCSDLKFGLIGNSVNIEPVYHVTTGINSNQLNNIIKNVNINLIDNIPDYLIKKYDFIDKKAAIKEIHNPTNEKKFILCKNRLKYEELFMFMLKINYLKLQKHNKGLYRKVEKEEIIKFINTLPFKLTLDQFKAVDDIYNDLVSEKRMNRLIQGDVGSGKTVVSFIALYINYLSGYQGALMAPTEILASQHYEKLLKLLPNLNIKLLTGKMKASEKKLIYNDLISGKINIIIGTHALITDNVKYNNLGLVITDEQHRFGVNQRGLFKNKGIMADVLYMSATPIPRTYAITLFGDMDISSIKTKPSGRKEIISLLKKNSEIKFVLNLMLEELKKKHQIYVVAPSIEENEKIQMENVIKLKNNMEKAFGKYFTVGVLHGKLKSKEKDDIMNQFKLNNVQILISTTVIEVGVDVPNATVMVIFDSYRFGLSTLHQLRGRVGRSNLQSYFIMISDQESERLKVLTKTNDGFLVSEADFKLRGSGDLFGVRQSGDMQFKLADLKKDFSLVLKAKEDSLEFLRNNNNFILNKLDTLD